MKPTKPMGPEYKRAVEVLEAMGRMHRSWIAFQPAPPLTRSDMMTLGVVDEMARHGPVTVSRLARRMHQSMPGISQKVSALEQTGYLRRAADKKDRRVSYIELTEKGSALAEQTMREFLGRIERALDMLGPDKAHELTDLMHQMSDAIEQMKDLPGGETDPPGGENGAPGEHGCTVTTE